MGRMLKQFEEARAEILSATEKHIIRLKKADEITRGIRQLIPKDWEFEYSDLLESVKIVGENKTDLFEFRNICNLVEKIAGRELRKTTHTTMDDDNNKEYLYFIDAQAHIKAGEYKDYSVYLGIIVRMRPPHKETFEGCKITYEEKTVQIAKIDPGCLGNHQAKEA